MPDLISYLQFVLAPQMLNGLALGVSVILVALGLTIIFLSVGKPMFPPPAKSLDFQIKNISAFLKNILITN